LFKVWNLSVDLDRRLYIYLYREKTADSDKNVDDNNDDKNNK